MAQFLALEWNGREAQVIVASGRGSRVVVEHAFAIPWSDEEAADPLGQRMGERIAEELQFRGIGCTEALVGVGRTNIELRQIHLPPAPDEELPDMVRFQAGREFNEFDDRWLLDFLPIDETPHGPRTVLATAIAPAMIQQIEEVCRHAKLKMRRLLLRSCEAASLMVGDLAADADSPSLLVTFFTDEADLTTVLNGKAVFLRTMRYAGELPHLPTLLAEIRLTMAATQNQLGRRKTNAIVLCGKEKPLADLAQSIEAELGIHVAVFEPFDAVEVTPSVKNTPLANRGRFAPLIGMLKTEARRTGHAIDFLHPRRRVEPPNPKRKGILVGATVALLLLAWIVYARIAYFQLVSEVDELTVQAKLLDADIAAAKQSNSAATAIAKWTDSEVVWLDQLRGLNQHFPPPEDAVVKELTCDATQAGNPQVILKGRARNADVVAKMEDRIRADGGQIAAPSGTEDGTVKNYPWSFETKLLLKRGAKP